MKKIKKVFYKKGKVGKLEITEYIYTAGSQNGITG